MIIKKVIAKSILDSRKKPTILVILKTNYGKFKTSAPSGKSTGVHEVSCYKKSLQEDIKEINNINLKVLNEINFKRFDDLDKLEKLISENIGGNSLFALEACILKALAKEHKKELWQFLGAEKKIIRPVGNTIGGGLHSQGQNGMRPDIQEFLFIANGSSFKENFKINKLAYKLTKKLLKAKKRNDEGAWETSKTNEEVLDVMFFVRALLKRKGFHIDIGLDVASSSFYEKNKYVYNNPPNILTKKQQIAYVLSLIKKYNILYVEDPLEEDDFSGFKELNKKTSAMIVGDDLTTTNPARLMKAIKEKAIKGIIVKPNQIGSLLKVKKVIEISKRFGIKTIISHRSGETLDTTIADLGAGLGVDFIKTGTYGKYRAGKLKRLIKIERKRK